MQKADFLVTRLNFKENITVFFLPYCHLLNMKTNIGPVNRLMSPSWVSSQVLKCYNCFLHAFTSTLHTLFHPMLKLQCSAFISLGNKKKISSEEFTVLQRIIWENKTILFVHVSFSITNHHNMIFTDIVYRTHKPHRI